MRSPVISRARIATVLLFALLALVPVYSTLFSAPFYLTLFARVMIFALAAVSLDLVLGFGGLVSFGHAAYLGVGAYAVGILAHHGVDSAALQWGTAILASALVALFVGAAVAGTAYSALFVAISRDEVSRGSIVQCRYGRAKSSATSSTAPPSSCWRSQAARSTRT